jgi:hypothetical protein
LESKRVVVGVADIMCRKHGNRKAGAVVDSGYRGSSKEVSVEDEDITSSFKPLNNLPTLLYL